VERPADRKYDSAQISFHTYCYLLWLQVYATGIKHNMAQISTHLFVVLDDL
jgi:hypothetical protein